MSLPRPPTDQFTSYPSSMSEEEQIMAAMNELSETFIENEEATLLALKEISSSMKMLAQQTVALQLARDQQGQQQQAPPSQPVAQDPAPAAPAASSPPKKSYAVSSAKWKTASSGAAGASYLDSVVQAPPAQRAPAQQAAVSPPPPAAQEAAYSPPSPAAAAAVNPLLPQAIGEVISNPPPATPKVFPPQKFVPSPPPPDPGAITPREVAVVDPDSNALATLSLTIAGLGLLWAVASNSEYAQNLPEFQATTYDGSGGKKSAEKIVTQEEITADQVLVPPATAPESPTAPEVPAVPVTPAVPDTPPAPVEEAKLGDDAKVFEEQRLAEEARIFEEQQREAAEAAAKAAEAAKLAEAEAAAKAAESARLELEAEQQRLEAEQKARLEAEQQEKARLEKEAEQRRLEEEAAAAKAAEQARLAAEQEKAAKAAEETRKAEEARLAEATRIKSLFNKGAAKTGAAAGAGAVAAGTGAATAGAVAAGAATAGSMAPPAVATVAPAKSSVFSYDPSSQGGPASWSTLNIEGNQCGGSKQSPIAIKPTGCTVGGNYLMEANPKCSTENLGYALGKGGPKAMFTESCAGNTIEIPVLEGKFEAVQFHTHIGSEHTIGGQRYGAELHIVHKEQKGDRFAVVGIMINGDGQVENPLFSKLLDKWSAVEQQVTASCDGVAAPKKSRPFVSDATFNIYDLIPKGSAFYHYDGSLTTPPCSEVVWWEVVDKPLSVSPGQYDRLVKMTTTYTDPNTCEVTTAASPLDGSTNRPTAQDLGGREVQKICPVEQIGESPVPMAYAEELDQQQQQVSYTDGFYEQQQQQVAYDEYYQQLQQQGAYADEFYQQQQQLDAFANEFYQHQQEVGYSDEFYQQEQQQQQMTTYIFDATQQTMTAQPEPAPESNTWLASEARQWSRFTADDYDPYQGM